MLWKAAMRVIFAENEWIQMGISQGAKNTWASGEKHETFISHISICKRAPTTLLFSSDSLIKQAITQLFKSAWHPWTTLFFFAILKIWFIFIPSSPHPQAFPSWLWALHLERQCKLEYQIPVLPSWNAYCMWKLSLKSLGNSISFILLHFWRVGFQQYVCTMYFKIHYVCIILLWKQNQKLFINQLLLKDKYKRNWLPL